MPTHLAPASGLWPPLLYFHLFQRPLTALEVWRWQNGIMSLPEVDSALQALVSAGRLHCDHGFYGLPGVTVDERQRRYRWSSQKDRIIRRWSLRLRALPWVDDVGVCNSLAWYHGRRESDIDFVIACRPGCLWLTRAVAVAWLRLCDMRPTPTVQRNRICLSFYIASDDGAVGGVAQQPDPYLLYWTASVRWSGVMTQQWALANDWVAADLPQAWSCWSLVTTRLPWWTRAMHATGRLLPDQVWRWLSRKLQLWQLQRLPSGLASKIGVGTDVVVNDTMIKLHATDRRKQYAERYAELCRLQQF